MTVHLVGFCVLSHFVEITGGDTRDEKLDLHSVKCLVKGAIKTAFVTALHAFDARQILSLRLPLQGGLRW